MGTVPPLIPAKLRRSTRRLAATLLAAGELCHLERQRSDVPAIAFLQ